MVNGAYCECPHCPVADVVKGALRHRPLLCLVRETRCGSKRAQCQRPCCARFLPLLPGGPPRPVLNLTPPPSIRPRFFSGGLGENCRGRFEADSRSIRGCFRRSILQRGALLDETSQELSDTGKVLRGVVKTGVFGSASVLRRFIGGPVYWRAPPSTF